MSYNPAFVADESPQCAGETEGQANGIKLTSFKPLQVADLPHTNTQAQKTKSHSKTAKPQTKRCERDNQLLSTSSSLSLLGAGDQSLVTTATGTTTTNTATISTSSDVTSSSSSSASSSLVQPESNLCAAVECRDMRYAVGRGKSAKTILHDINVTVPEGSIYGLLGPSGCGKTTMLRCVVGRIKPRSGQVRVFGYRPNESGSQIPGPAIGYMPQVS